MIDPSIKDATQTKTGPGRRTSHKKNPAGTKLKRKAVMRTLGMTQGRHALGGWHSRPLTKNKRKGKGKIGRSYNPPRSKYMPHQGEQEIARRKARTTTKETT